jgi:hypothetical protein
MSDTPNLRHATPEEVKEALSFALRFDGRKRHHRADLFMADFAAEKLVEHLQRAGFVVRKKPSAPLHYGVPPIMSSHSRGIRARSLVHPRTERHLVSWSKIASVLGLTDSGVQYPHARTAFRLADALNRRCGRK